MRLEEVMPALREGKCVRRQEWHRRVPGLHVKRAQDGYYRFHGGPHLNHVGSAFHASSEDFAAEDWEIVTMEEAAASQPIATHTCGRRYEQARTQAGEQHHDHYRADGRCSYCGSVSQEVFLKFVRDGGEVGPTDKSYKVYLHDVKDESGNVTVQAPGLKFYFQHLDDMGRAEFIALYNDKKMRIGYPGHFYTRPYFCTPVDKEV
jgi:hypothetical protein